MPGTLGGAFIVDRLGAKWTMVNRLINRVSIHVLTAAQRVDNWSSSTSHHRIYNEWALCSVRIRIFDDLLVND